jgi:hypothetical protein
MARSARLYRTECELDEFGLVLLEIKEDGIRIVSRERAGEVHSWTWGHLKTVCKCSTCLARPGGQIKADML